MDEIPQRQSLMVLPNKTIDEASASFRGHFLAFQQHWKRGMQDNPMGYPDEATMPDWLDYFIEYMVNKSSMYKRVPVDLTKDHQDE